jgi:hypothetical protein
MPRKNPDILGKKYRQGSKLFFGILKTTYKVGKAAASQSSRNIKTRSHTKRASQKQQALIAKKVQAETRWKNNFYKAIENDNRDLANTIIMREQPGAMINSNLDKVYKSLKRSDAFKTIFTLIFISPFVIFAIWILAKCS